MPTLYEISDDLECIEEIFQQDSDATESENQAIIDDWLDDALADLNSKVDGYVSLIKEKEARANARKAESQRLSQLAKTEQSGANYLKKNLWEFFEHHKIPKMKTRRFNVGVVGCGGVRPLEISCPVESLPEAYRIEVTLVNPDKKAIREAIESGEEIKGCELLKRGTRLSIK